MRTSISMVLITLVVGAVAFFTGHTIWPDVPGAMQPSAQELPFFVILSVAESLLFGYGVSFIIFGWRAMVRSTEPEFFAAVAWLLLSWWPHDNMHRANEGGDLAGLLIIEYIFHFTLMVAGLVIARHFWRLVKNNPTSLAAK